MDIIFLPLVLLLFPIEGLDADHKVIECLGNRVDRDGNDFRYTSIREFTSDMCAQCYGFVQSAGLHMREVKHNNETYRFRPLITYMVNNTGVLCEDRTRCFFVIPSEFNRTHPETDRILSTMTSEFYQVISC